MKFQEGGHKQNNFTDTQFHMFFIAFIAWKGRVTAGLNVFYRVILLKLPHATIKSNFTELHRNTD